MKLASLNLRQQQTMNIVMITFWSQFSSYALNAVLILFLTRPILAHGLGYSQEHAYSFMGISNATGYLMPILGGYVADRILGLRRSILFGGFLLALAYLLIMLSGYTIPVYGDKLFIAAYALTPAVGSLLMGTASGLVSRIYGDNAAHAKSAMTYYYMAINVGALLSILIAPALLDSRYGPLSVLAVTFVGKSIAALNFAYRYSIYNNIALEKDNQRMTGSTILYLMGYLLSIYLFTLSAYSFISLFSVIISLGCFACIGWFLMKTYRLTGETRIKQFIACTLIFEAIVFFVIYNQMNSTLILFAQNNSDMQLCGFSISPAQYQILNPLLIILLGLQLPRFYQQFPRFSIPYQFAVGTCLAGLALFIMAIATMQTTTGIISGNIIALTYILITLAELFVSAIGLSMIGLYCDNRTLGFAMGAWYLGCSLSNIFSGRIAHWVAIPTTQSSPLQSILIYQHYYLYMGMAALISSFFMFIFSYCLHKKYLKQGLVLA